MRTTIGRSYGIVVSVILGVVKLLNAIRYTSPLWFDRLTTNDLVNTHH